MCYRCGKITLHSKNLKCLICGESQLSYYDNFECNTCASITHDLHCGNRNCEYYGQSRDGLIGCRLYRNGLD